VFDRKNEANSDIRKGLLQIEVRITVTNKQKHLFFNSLPECICGHAELLAHGHIGDGRDKGYESLIFMFHANGNTISLMFFLAFAHPTLKGFT
ncbi:MAG: hypothetical protein LBB90_11290, partial [Tannerella sp.]|jgi:hypothetical protein|nr:hypothetical protein [Tannerella sp.]